MVYLSLYGTPRRESAISDHNSPLNVALTRSFPPPSLFLLLFPPASLLPFILSFFFPASPSLCLTTKKPLFPRSFFSRRLFMIRRGKHFPYIMEQTYMNSSWGRRRSRIKRRRSTATQGRGPFLRPCHQLTYRRCYVRVRARFVRPDDLAQDVFPPSFPSLSFLKSSPILSLSIFQTM